MILKLKKKIRPYYQYIKHYVKWFYDRYWNRHTKQQNKNFKQIPIIIISFNQLTYLKLLVDFLIKNNYTNLVIIDNHSTYVPLLNYFESMREVLTIHQLDTNEGHMVFWKNKALFNLYGKGYYVVTDSDIVPDANCPSDFLLHFKKILDTKSNISKVGFSLKIDDIPATNQNKQKILAWESKFWIEKDAENNYIAPIDTTFALYRPNTYYIANDLFYKGIRVSYPYVAKHGGWYIDSNHFTEEQAFYYQTANASSSWKTNQKGEVEKSLYSNL